MPKFNVGDRVVLPSDKIYMTQEFSGRAGTVTEVHDDTRVVSSPGGPLGPTYMVQFDREDEAMLVGEDWLELG